MTPAIFDAVSVDLEIGKGESIFRASGQTLKFPGFMSVYMEDEDEPSDEKENSSTLPPLEVGEILNIFHKLLLVIKQKQKMLRRLMKLSGLQI